jgi:hypothetical protein
VQTLQNPRFSQSLKRESATVSKSSFRVKKCSHKMRALLKSWMAEFWDISLNNIGWTAGGSLPTNRLQMMQASYANTVSVLSAEIREMLSTYTIYWVMWILAYVIRSLLFLYRVIHKSFRDFRPLRYSSRDRHAKGKHVNRGRDDPSFCSTLQVLGSSFLLCVLVVEQQSSEVPEVLMNYPVFIWMSQIFVLFL